MKELVILDEALQKLGYQSMQQHTSFQEAVSVSIELQKAIKEIMANHNIKKTQEPDFYREPV